MGGLEGWARQLPAGPMHLLIFAWLFVESTGFPISDEPLLLLTGYLAQVRRIDLALAIGVALIGKVSASYCAYWVGHHLDLSVLARPLVRPASGLGRWLYLVQPAAGTLSAAERRFREQGAWGVLVARLVPVVRSFISYPAGAARMPTGIFLAATTAGSLIWIVTWTLLGLALDKSYDALLVRWGRVSWLVLAIFLLALALLWLRGRHRGRTEIPGSGEAEPVSEHIDSSTRRR